MDDYRENFLYGGRLEVDPKDKRRTRIHVTGPHLEAYRHLQAVRSLNEDEEPTEDIPLHERNYTTVNVAGLVLLGFGLFLMFWKG